MPYEEKDPLILELLADFQRLWEQVVDLTHVDDVFWQVLAILKDHPELGKAEHPTFQEWMLDCYVAKIVVGLRTLVDKDTRSYSFIHLLDKMESNCSKFSRARHYLVCSGTPAGFVDEWFDRIAGAGDLHVPASRFQALRSLLVNEVDPLKQFVDQKVAHLDRQPMPSAPTTDHVRSALCAARYVL